MSVELGKITSVRIGKGGYQDCQFGVWFGLGGKSWGVGDGKGPWANHDAHCKWTLEDQAQEYAAVMRYLHRLCNEAGVDDVAKLQGKPVEVTFEDNKLRSWRILKEVL